MTLAELHRAYLRRRFSELLAEFSSALEKRFSKRSERGEHASTMWGYCRGFQDGLGSAVASALHRAAEQHGEAATCIESLEAAIDAEEEARAEVQEHWCPVCRGRIK